MFTKQAGAVVGGAFNPSTWQAEAGEFLSLRPGSQPGLQSEFQDSQGYTKKPCLEKNKNKNKTNKQTKDLHLQYRVI